MCQSSLKRPEFASQQIKGRHCSSKSHTTCKPFSIFAGPVLPERLEGTTQLNNCHPGHFTFIILNTCLFIPILIASHVNPHLFVLEFSPRLLFTIQIRSDRWKETSSAKL